MPSYNLIKIEEKWRKRWEEKGAFKVDIKKAKNPYYNLMMFPYPSAEGLHIGNVYAFTGSDIHGRYMRMKGFDVFEPIGFDAFGIHSENFAIKRGAHPRDETEKNVNNFRNQLKQMGAIFDWDREIDTSKPDYYKWTQWLFIQFYKAGLAYRAKAPVDWCPSCKTVLADEQVIGGRCERCGSEIIQKELEQWFLKITDYAEKLLSNLERIDWSEEVKTAQRNWIGKSAGALLKFKMKSEKGKITDKNLKWVDVFTTRPDTLFGATYLVLSPEHPAVLNLKSKILNLKEVEEYINTAKTKSELERTDLAKEKTGVEIRGIKAINPANGEEIPIWIADYVLSGYGTGAIMAVPGHDSRDYDFAKKYVLSIVQVILPHKSKFQIPNLKSQTNPNYQNSKINETIGNAYEGDGILINSGDFNGMDSLEAKEKITKFVGGERKINYHLRDWLISRQRYWGPPIPIMYCRICWENKKSKIKNKKEGVHYITIDGVEYAIVPVPEKDLPVELPYVEEFRPTGTSKSPLASMEEFIKTKCPTCGGEARRETDVSDTFLDSSWYFLRYPSVGLKIKNLKLKIPWDPKVTRQWLPVDMYIGGKEHAVLHLMYARFVTMALKDMGHIDFEEPFDKFRAHGLLIREGAKMSKSKGNVINPDDYFESYGADVLRMYLMFLGPYEQGGDWQDKGIAGISRFLKRVWRLVDDYTHGAKPPNFQFSIFNFQTNPNDSISKTNLGRLTHKTIKKVTEDIENLQYNTAIAALMEFTNQITNNKQQITNGELKVLLKLLAPFAPHLTEELWEQLGNKNSIHNEAWPEYDEKQLMEDKVKIVVQINGKVRAQIEADAGASEEAVKNLALKEDKIFKFMGDSPIKKVVFVQNKLINFVV